MGRGQSRGNNRGRSKGAIRGRGGARGGIRGRGGSRGTRAGGSKVDNKLDRWKTAEDVPMDEEDEFFAARDKILLDDTARARARAGPGQDDGDEFDQDDEVFGLDGVGGTSSEDEEDEDEDGDFEDDPPASSKSKGKGKQTAQAESSDDASDSEEELSHWGKSRSAYYADNSRVMDEDDAEAREMEEREGRRLQAKSIAEIGEDDWGYNDVHDAEDVVDSLSAVPVTPPLPTDKASLLRHMEKHDPLALALARDWEDTAYQVMETTAAVKEVGASNPDDPSLGLMHLHHQTLLSYATTLAFYLHLQSTPSGADSSDLASFPEPLAPTEAKRLRTSVISRLLTLKQALATLEDLGFAAGEVGEDDEDEFSDEDDMSVDGGVSFQVNGNVDAESSDEDVSPFGIKPGEQVSYTNGGTPRLQNLEEEWQQDKIAGWMGSSVAPEGDKEKKKRKKKQLEPELGDLEEGELEALMQDALELEEPPTSSPPKKRGKKLDIAEPEIKEVKKKKKKKDIAPAAPTFDLVEPEFASTKSKDKGKQVAATNGDVDSEAFGDPTQLSHTDASDKAGRRRTLRFHTSKIERQARRLYALQTVLIPWCFPAHLTAAWPLALGWAETTTYLTANDEKTKSKKGSERAAMISRWMLGWTMGPIDEESEGEDGYYDLVRKAKKQRKDEKKAEYESMRAAERIDPDEDSAPGPRSLTRAILKNRGMTPNRSPKNKAARNPRVKKKMQYAKAQKKLGSRQAVFKGGAEVAAAREGRYEGEKSGISGSVVKSVKL
ncbi:hypothetical protein FRC12_001325 [Ceratobasidium sp. 428]|nr:hypothetical protein FRC12_001325 [Ceratobasidium sp. 428]